MKGLRNRIWYQSARLRLAHSPLANIAGRLVARVYHILDGSLPVNIWYLSARLRLSQFSPVHVLGRVLSQVWRAI